MNEFRPDYFRPVMPVEAILRRVKGNDRKDMLLGAIERDGIETIPEDWLAHELSALQVDI